MLRMVACLMLIGGIALPALECAGADDPGIEALLQDFVRDFQSDPMASEAITFGIRVRDAVPPEWHVIVSGSESGGSWDVSLVEGFPEERVIFYQTDLATVTEIHSGRLGSLTAMGKTNDSDPAPLDIVAVPGVSVTPGLLEHFKRLNFHFWTRGFPEVVRFDGLAEARELHGANVVLFYQQEGFRSGWFRIEKGQHVNQQEGLQANPFPAMLVVTKGTLESKIGGKDVTLKAGQSVYIGPNVRHEFWNDVDEAAECVIMMFGGGA